MLRLHAPAKVNLFLRILAREESGFHQLETLFSTLEFGDSLTLEGSTSGIFLEIDGPPMGPPEENLVYRAAKAFLEEGGVREGVKIRLKKRIPAASGLGGGSSDAATTLLGLRDLFPLAVGAQQLLHLAGELGSDVPFFLGPSPLTLAWGRGDRLAPLSPPPPAPVLLALPPIKISTPEAYALLVKERREAAQRHTPRTFPLESFSSWERVGAFVENDFEAPIFRAFPLLGRIRSALGETGALFSLLSGSGSALFALHENDQNAKLAMEELVDRFPDTRFVFTRTVSAPEKVRIPQGVEPRVGD